MGRRAARLPPLVPQGHSLEPVNTSTRSTSTAFPRARHRFAVVLACVVVLLVAAGALVKSKDAGLSVPDWPLSYGTLNPPGWWLIDTVRAEHGHRLFAGSVALATVILALWTWRAERRRNVRRLGGFAVAAVFAQALLGGLTVLLFLPPAISIAHAALAEIFLCLITALAVVTSRSWLDGAERVPLEIHGIRRLALATTATIFGQILIGAFVRHLGAGLAIPDFPLVFGGLVPKRFDLPIAIHYSHRVGAVLVTTLITILAIKVFRRERDSGALNALKMPLGAMVFLVVCQIGLGGWLVLSGRAVVPNTVHVATGAAIFALSLVVTLHSFRLSRRSELTRAARREALSAHATDSFDDEFSHPEVSL